MDFSFIPALQQLGAGFAMRLINQARPAANYLLASILPETPMTSYEVKNGSMTADTFTYVATGSNATATGTITASFQAVGMLETNAAQNAASHALSGYSLLVGGVFYENLCPDAAGDPKVIPAQYKSELVANGCSIKFAFPYADSRA